MAMTFEIEKHLGVIAQKGPNSIEANLISYNHMAPKVDIRRWYSNAETGQRLMQRGLTMTEDEAQELVDILQTYLMHK